MAEYLPCLGSDELSKDSLITRYFGQGYTNVEIIAFLSLHHNYVTSLSTLKRSLRRLGLRKRIPLGCEEDREEIRDFISKELLTSGRNLGMTFFNLFLARYRLFLCL